MGTGDGVAPSASAAPHDLSDEVAGDWRPWPLRHEPGTPGERRMWRAFATVRDEEGARLTPRSVGRRAGMSPTPIAHGKGAYSVLREAILAEMARRAPRKEPEPSREEQEAAALAHRETRITYWKAVAQEADSRNMEFEARALRAEAKAATATALMRRVLEDLRSGRWTVADPDAVTIADLIAAVGPAPRQAGDGAADACASDAMDDGEDGYVE